MEELISSGSIAALAIGIVIAEAAILVPLWMRWRIGIRPAELLFNLGAGGSLMLSLLLAQIGAPWWALALALISAMVCHVLDQRQRWRPTSTRPN